MLCLHILQESTHSDLEAPWGVDSSPYIVEGRKELKNEILCCSSILAVRVYLEAGPTVCGIESKRYMRGLS